MKNILVVCLVLLATNLFSQKNVEVKIDWIFKGIVAGYDHEFRFEVYVDGKNVTTSTIARQSVKNKVVIPVKGGTHTIRVVGYAKYENNWEIHSIENDYAMDAIYEFTEDFKRKKKISLVLDLDAAKVLTE